jgi:glycosyltransferase involved in cell wall biosynthesis
MKIAVNTRLLIPDKLEGIGWFTHETLKRIVQAHPEHEFLFLFDRPYDERFIYGPNVTPLVIGPPARHPILFYIWFEWRLPAILRKHKADVFLSPDGYLSIRSKVPQVAVFHDINFEHFPEYVPFAARLHYRHFFRKYAQKAARIATVSAYSKKDICETYGVESSKIDVVYNGVNTAFKPLGREEILKVRSEYSDGKPYFLFVGAIHPRKNLANQLRAYLHFRKETGLNYPFLIVGATYWRDREIEEVIGTTAHRKDILFLGRKDVSSLVKLYGAAEALMYVSHFEGFGIPMVEAMRAEVPVITSKETSMPEICGDAGLICDPNNPNEIAQAMMRISSDPELRETLIAAGRIQGAKFSWDKTADALWKTIERALEKE